MNPDRSLKFLLIRDAILFLAFTAYFYLPTHWSGRAVPHHHFVGGKGLSGNDGKLEPQHKKIYFAETCFFAILWLGLLLAWLIRHSSPATWMMGSLGIIVLLTLLYASYDNIYGITRRSNQAMKPLTEPHDLAYRAYFPFTRRSARSRS